MKLRRGFEPEALPKEACYRQPLLGERAPGRVTQSGLNGGCVPAVYGDPDNGHYNGISNGQ